MGDRFKNITMFITGNPLTDLLTYLALVLPLLTVSFILYKKAYQDNSTTLIMILCLLFFINRVMIQANDLFGFSYPIIHNIFSAAEFGFTVLLFRDHFHTDRMKIMLNGFLIAYLSSTVTFALVEGFDSDPYALLLLQNGLMAGLMVAMLVQLMMNPMAASMSQTIFWITVSNLFFFGFMAIWETGKHFVFPNGKTMVSETESFPMIVMSIRFGIYALAIWFLEPERKIPTKRLQGMTDQQQVRNGHVTVRGPYDLINESSFMIPARRNG
jgi:hypothetical protein